MASTTRRDLFAAAGATALAGIATAAIAMPETLSGASGPDALLIAACDWFVQLEHCIAEVETGTHRPGSAADRAEDAAVRKIRAAQEPLIERMKALPTRTHAGFQARARAILAWEHGDMERRANEGGVSDALTWPLMRDLAGATAVPVSKAATARPEPDAALLAACARYEAVFHATNAMIRDQSRTFGAVLPESEIARHVVAFNDLHELETEIAGYPATTHAGMAGKAMVLQMMEGSLEPCQPGETNGLLWSLTMDLAGAPKSYGHSTLLRL